MLLLLETPRLLVQRQQGRPCLVGSLCLTRAKRNLGRSPLGPGVQLRTQRDLCSVMPGGPQSTFPGPFLIPLLAQAPKVTSERQVFPGQVKSSLC